MKIEVSDAIMETEYCNDYFILSITEENDCSLDGGYSFENVTNSAYLTKAIAQSLMDELQRFLTPTITHKRTKE